MASWQVAATNPEPIRRSRSDAIPLALALLVISVFINYVDRGNLSIAAPLLKTELGLSISQYKPLQRTLRPLPACGSLLTYARTKDDTSTLDGLSLPPRQSQFLARMIISN